MVSGSAPTQGSASVGQDAELGAPHANIALPIIYAMTIVSSAIGEWNYYLLGSALEVAALAAIVSYAWTWPKLGSAEVPFRRLSDHETP